MTEKVKENKNTVKTAPNGNGNQPPRRKKLRHEDFETEKEMRSLTDGEGLTKADYELYDLVIKAS